MKSISKLKESEKFNKFIQECGEFAKSISADDDIVKSFPRFILKLYFNLNKDCIEEALRGLGSNDDGIDAFFISEEEKKYYLIQFKSRKHFDEKESKNAKKEWFSFLETFTERILRDNFKTKNKRIQEIKEQIDSELSGYTQELCIFHLGGVSEEIESSFSNVLYYSQEDILKEFVQYYETDLPDDYAPDNIELDINPQQIQNFQTQNNYIYFTPKAKNGKPRKTVVFPINGEQIIELINQGTTILERNVRGYLGDSNKVNKGIITTALESPEYFYFFNNGISITCDELVVIGHNKDIPKIKLMKPQIINGAQTVNSLKSAYEHKLKFLKKNKINNYEREALNYMKAINVLCKIMESNKSLNTDFAKEVTKFSNTQNKIKPTDFYANRLEQIKIKEEMKKYGITYNIKRGKNFEYKEGYFINMEDLGENHYAQIEEPFFAKATQIFVDNCENDDKSSYTKIFGNNGSYNAKRTMELAKTFFIYHFVSNKFNYIKKTFNDFELLIGKNQTDIDKFENDNKEFFKITSSKKYFDDFIKQKNDLYGDIILKYLLIMDFKILSYIVRQLIENYSVKNSDEEISKISLLFETYISQTKYDQIELLMQIVLKQALKLYGQSIKDILKENGVTKVQKRHSKSKEARSIIEQKISEYISEEEYIKFEF